MTVTFAQLIQDVARASQDFVPVTATTTGGDNQTVISNNDLLEDDDHFRGCEAYFLDGANVGLTRRVLGSDFETTSLTVYPPLPAPVSAGHRVELYNFRPGGLKRRDYAAYINQAIRETAGAAGQVAMETLTAVYGGAQVVPIPTLNSVCRVQYYDSYSSDWNDVKRAVRPGGKGWWPLPELQSIALSADWQISLANYAIRAVGYGAPGQLVLDADTTPLDPEWLVKTAASYAQMGNPDNYQNLGPGQYALNRADAVRGKVGTVPMANCARVR